MLILIYLISCAFMVLLSNNFFFLPCYFILGNPLTSLWFCWNAWSETITNFKQISSTWFYWIKQVYVDKFTPWANVRCLIYQLLFCLCVTTMASYFYIFSTRTFLTSLKWNIEVQYYFPFLIFFHWFCTHLLFYHNCSYNSIQTNFLKRTRGK